MVLPFKELTFSMLTFYMLKLHEKAAGAHFSGYLNNHVYDHGSKIPEVIETHQLGQLEGNKCSISDTCQQHTMLSFGQIIDLT